MPFFKTCWIILLGGALLCGPPSARAGECHTADYGVQQTKLKNADGKWNQTTSIQNTNTGAVLFVRKSGTLAYKADGPDSDMHDMSVSYKLLSVVGPLASFDVHSESCEASCSSGDDYITYDLRAIKHAAIQDADVFGDEFGPGINVPLTRIWPEQIILTALKADPYIQNTLALKDNQALRQQSQAAGTLDAWLALLGKAAFYKRHKNLTGDYCFTVNPSGDKAGYSFNDIKNGQVQVRFYLAAYTGAGTCSNAADEKGSASIVLGLLLPIDKITDAAVKSAFLQSAAQPNSCLGSQLMLAAQDKNPKP